MEKEIIFFRTKVYFSNTQITNNNKSKIQYKEFNNSPLFKKAQDSFTSFKKIKTKFLIIFELN